MVCQPGLNTYMARLLFLIIALFTFLSVSAKAEQPDLADNKDYQSLAGDFRMYSVCQSIHQNLAMFIAINYGVGSNLNFPEDWKNQQRSLINNIVIQEETFGNKLIVTIQKLHEEFGMPLQGLQNQKARNQSQTTQSIIFTVAGSINDPDKVTLTIKNMLNESVKCRAYKSAYNYER
jgi:hypothetical protein